MNTREIDRINALVRIGATPARADKGYMARLLVQCTLPHSDPDPQLAYFERVNGDLRLAIQPGPGQKIPSGSYPRLVLAWMSREVVKTKERTLVLGDSLSDFMWQLGLSPTGGRWGSITRLREQMKRLLTARIVVTSENERRFRGGAMSIATEWDLWWSPKSPEQATIWESTVTLGERLFNEMLHYPVPFDMRVLKQIKQSALAIDLYLFSTYRMSYLKEPTAITWKQLHAQFGADYSGKYGYDNFRKECLKHLQSIKLAWPEFTFDTPRGRLRLYPSRPHIEPRPAAIMRG